MEQNKLIAATYNDLADFSEDMTSDEFARIAEKYPVRIPGYYLSLIDSCDRHDPIRKMCVPSAKELSEDGAYDTSGEGDNTVVRGLQHKYRQTALILSTNQCAMYCRYCFRRRLVGAEDEPEVVSDIGKVMEYLAGHQEINNVLISGGDSFMLTNTQIEAYLRNLCAIDHLDLIRFGTKTPVVFPTRISEDAELLGILKQYSKLKQIYVVTQYNHSRELTEESKKAIRKLQESGVIVKNQSVLLKGVNDDADVLGELLRNLTKIGIVPYYVFQCRPVRGIKNQFQVPIRKGIEIIEQAKAMQNGNGKCFRYALSNRAGKLEIVGADPKGAITFKYHQAKAPDDQGRIFVRQLEDHDCWVE